MRLLTDRETWGAVVREEGIVWHEGPSGYPVGTLVRVATDQGIPDRRSLALFHTSDGPEVQRIAVPLTPAQMRDLASDLMDIACEMDGRTTPQVWLAPEDEAGRDVARSALGGETLGEMVKRHVRERRAQRRTTGRLREALLEAVTTVWRARAEPPLADTWRATVADVYTSFPALVPGDMGEALPPEPIRATPEFHEAVAAMQRVAPPGLCPKCKGAGHDPDDPEVKRGGAPHAECPSCDGTGEARP